MSNRAEWGIFAIYSQSARISDVGCLLLKVRTLDRKKPGCLFLLEFMKKRMDVSEASCNARLSFVSLILFFRVYL